MATETSVHVVPMESADRATLRNLLQLYQYDFSDIERMLISDDGRFHQLDTVEFDHGYLITANGSLAGFALVRRQRSSVELETEVWSMQEFFVMRQYRRTGVGRRAAMSVVERHPGAWEVTETPHNLNATEFWRNVLRAYGCQESTVDDPHWGQRPVQRFSHP